MIMGRDGNWRASMAVGGKSLLLTASPRRSNAGEKHKQTADDENRAVHKSDDKTLPYE
jgi:hypothetical protein